MCYAANRHGIDVSDFRGGHSQELFSNRSNNQKAYDIANAITTRYEVSKEVKEVGNIIKGIAENKEYILSTGKHSAVIRKTADGLQYLELQSSLEGGNGWKPFETSGKTVYDTLYERFGCRKTVDKSKLTGTVYKKTARLIDVDSFQPTEEFKDILGYVNTPAAKQKRGSSGGIK